MIERGNFVVNRYPQITIDFAESINLGLIPGYSTFSKFGENPDIDTGSAPEDVWEAGGTYVYDAPGTAPIRFLSSSSALDVGQSVEIQGLDIAGNLVVQTIVTTGQASALLTTPLWRVFRAANVSDDGNSINGTLYIHADDTTTAGVPDANLTRAIIDDGNNQTLMALFTIPLGKVGFIYRGEIGASRSQTSGEIEGAYFTRRVGKLFRKQKRVNVTNQGSSIYQDKRTFPDALPALMDVKVVVENVSANNTGVFATFDILLANEDDFSPEYLAQLGQPSVMPT